jgi:hypothetical protein
MESFLHLVATHVYRRLALLVVVEQLASPRSHLRWHNRLTLEFRDDLAYKDPNHTEKRCIEASVH